MIKFWSKFHCQIFWYSFTWDYRFLLTPSLISSRKILPPAPLHTSTTALVCIFYPILNSVMEGWKYRSREFLKAIFCHQKKPTRKQTFSWNLHEFFLDICMKCLKPQVKIKKIVNQHTVNYHLNPAELTSRIHPLIFLRTPKWFIFSPECFLNFFSNLYFAPW